MHQTVLECLFQQQKIGQEIKFGTGSPDWLEPKSKLQVTVMQMRLNTVVTEIIVMNLLIIF